MGSADQFKNNVNHRMRKEGKEATKGQKQIDKENAASMSFYTYVTIAAVAVSWAQAIFFQTSYLLPLFG